MVEAEEAAALAKFWQAEPALAKSQQRLALCTALLPSAPSADIRLHSISPDLVTMVGLEVLATHGHMRNVCCWSCGSWWSKTCCMRASFLLDELDLEVRGDFIDSLYHYGCDKELLEWLELGVWSEDANGCAACEALGDTYNDWQGSLAYRTCKFESISGKCRCFDDHGVARPGGNVVRVYKLPHSEVVRRLEEHMDAADGEPLEAWDDRVRADREARGVDLGHWFTGYRGPGSSFVGCGEFLQCGCTYNGEGHDPLEYAEDYSEASSQAAEGLLAAGC